MTIANESGGNLPCRFCAVPWDRAKFSKCDCGAALDCYGNEQTGPVTYRTPEEWAKDIPQEDGARSDKKCAHCDNKGGRAFNPGTGMMSPTECGHCDRMGNFEPYLLQEDGAREGVQRYAPEVRYERVSGFEPEAHMRMTDYGEWVKHDDHLSVMARLKSERDAALGRYADAVLEGGRLKAVAKKLEGQLADLDAAERERWSDKRPDEERYPKDVYRTVWEMWGLKEAGCKVTWEEVDAAADEAHCAVAAFWSTMDQRGSVSGNPPSDLPIRLANAWRFQALEIRASEYVCQTLEHERADHAKTKAECAGLRALLSVARDSVEFEVQEKRQNWGDRLMHKQQGAIDLLAKITAFLTPTPADGRGGEQP